jgi:hypothetical protein
MVVIKTEITLSSQGKTRLFAKDKENISKIVYVTYEHEGNTKLSSIPGNSSSNFKCSKQTEKYEDREGTNSYILSPSIGVDQLMFPYEII